MSTKPTYFPLAIILLLLPLSVLPAAEFHVTIIGSDANPGTQAAPLRTIQRAADLAQPGDTVTVHAGVYREYGNPPRGGESDTKRIVYQAAPGEQVVITGSEEVKNWEKVQDGVWKATLPNTFFGSFNPFAELIAGAWFHAKCRSHHVVRNNRIAHCEQAGVVGSLGAVFSTVSGNSIHDIHVRQLFSGAEMEGIKFHGPIDATISGNHIYRTCRGIWLDWMTQGTRISNNLCHDNATHDLLVEANHGPFEVDNNIFLSPKSIEDDSQDNHDTYSAKKNVEQSSPPGIWHPVIFTGAGERHQPGLPPDAEGYRKPRLLLGLHLHGCREPAFRSFPGPGD